MITSAALCLLTLVATAGCLVPIPLAQQFQSDGGTGLVVERAFPPFGTLNAMPRTTPFAFQLYVKSDSPALAGRLCVQVNENCCMLNPPDTTSCQDDATVTQVGDPGSGEYELAFQQYPPCILAPGNVPRVYVVPVVATGGFAPTVGFIGAEGLGTVDATHYWTVNCQLAMTGAGDGKLPSLKPPEER